MLSSLGFVTWYTSPDIWTWESHGLLGPADNCTVQELGTGEGARAAGACCWTMPPTMPPMLQEPVERAHRNQEATLSSCNGNDSVPAGKRKTI